MYSAHAAKSVGLVNPLTQSLLEPVNQRIRGRGSGTAISPTMPIRLQFDHSNEQPLDRASVSVAPRLDWEYAGCLKLPMAVVLSWWVYSHSMCTAFEAYTFWPKRAESCRTRRLVWSPPTPDSRAFFPANLPIAEVAGDCDRLCTYGWCVIMSCDLAAAHHVHH